MKWIRCNNCFTRAELAKEPFSLTKCGHAFCNHCSNEAGRQCPVCKNINVPMVRLEEPLDRNTALYFTPVRDQLQQLLQVASLQEEQIRIAMKRFSELDSKYIYCKEVLRKLEIATAELNRKRRKDKEEYTKKLRNLENANMQLQAALDRAENRPYGNYRSTQNSSLTSLNPHTCSKRFQQNDSKVSFSTPMSNNTNSVGHGSGNSDRKYFSTPAEPDGLFRIPNISKLPRSAGGRSSNCSTASTPSNMIPRCLHLDSLMISRS